MNTEIINTRTPSRLDWDIAIEATNTILNEIIAWSSREKVLELQKPNPDKRRLSKLETRWLQAQRDNHPGNFKELPLMIAIIEKYSAVINQNF
ncbi:hypothetical protein MKQ68_19060 [Chitinophaga horti]|uniref:Uncharacterized protein n=1 Tax=Chitinophaga horti TaxID=2920382 RepID=A0ABY6IXS5_9BACT|nr:hypothetical protein [Chitinophaga horti]UYQ92190.1 hypothetical protein MKQ68_19060 [Chitinophaga horti]